MTRLLSLLVFALLVPIAASQTLYSVEQVGPAPTGGKANVINNAGLVGGTVSTEDSNGLDPTEAFLWQDGVIVWQGALGSGNAGVAYLNDAGDAAGDASNPGPPFLGETAAFFRPFGGDAVAIPAPTLPGGFRQVSYSGGLGTDGLVAGRWRRDDLDQIPVVWNPATGETTLLPTLNGNPARTTGIAANGMIVGAAVPGTSDPIHAVRWTPDGAGGYTLEDLGTIDGGTFSRCRDTNASGVCVGDGTTATNANGQVAVWEPGEPGRLLTPPAKAGACNASDINDDGVVVGRCSLLLPGGRVQRAIVWIDGEPTVLQDALDASGDGWTLTEALGVNNDGWIVGRATRDGVIDNSGQPENLPYLARPAGATAGESGPEPTALAVTAAPNPLGVAGTVLRVTLAGPSVLRAEIYDVRGRRVRTLTAGGRAAGPASLTWDGRDDAGRSVAPGVYLARLRADSQTATLRVSVVR